MEATRVQFRFVKQVLPMVVLAGGAIVYYALLQPDDHGHNHHPSARVKSDLRSLATAIETYKLDHGTYPEAGEYINEWRPSGDVYPLRPIGAGYIAGITTPVAYITSRFQDPFAAYPGEPYVYFKNGDGWLLLSCGLDLEFQILHPAVFYTGMEPDLATVAAKLAPYTYDPSNGMESAGDIWWAKR